MKGSPRSLSERPAYARLSQNLCNIGRVKKIAMEGGEKGTGVASHAGKEAWIGVFEHTKIFHRSKKERRFQDEAQILQPNDYRSDRLRIRF
jgi:hypothetical protein